MASPEAPAPRRRVRQLPPQLANQIAAGEVVARPANVVKELVENAIDAGASRIHVEIESGGVARVAVVDDGCGMDADDALLALSRHATSKLHSIEDLQAIGTLGFRGEALPSIASVSRMRVRTRTREADAGVEIVVDGGEAPEVKPCGLAAGTQIEVTDLFYNVPARRKFLRATATESAHVGEVVRDLALSHPRVGVELRRDGRLAQRWLPASSRRERVEAAFEGAELLGCVGERGGVRVEAYLSRPDRARMGAGGLAIFVVNRAVKDRALARAVASAYGPALEAGRYPSGALYVDLPLELVDVNVHPQKSEVRFASARAVTDAVYSVVQAALIEAVGLPVTAAAGQPPAYRPRSEPDPGGWTFSEGTAPAWPAAPPLDARKRPHATLVSEPTATLPPTTSLHHLATLRGRFLVYEAAEGIVIVDGRRALAQRIERELGAELAAGRVVPQRLLFPVALDCDEAACEAVERGGAAMEKLGFELARGGPRQVMAHAVPRVLADGPAEALVGEVLERLRRADEPPFGVDVPSLLAALAERTAGAAASPPLPGELDLAALADAVVCEVHYDELEAVDR
jgi:DNA mismatch repair protein MutL